MIYLCERYFIRWSKAGDRSARFLSVVTDPARIRRRGIYLFGWIPLFVWDRVVEYKAREL